MPIQLTGIGFAMKALQEGYKVSRYAWQDINFKFLMLIPGSEITVDEGRPLAKAGLPLGTKVVYDPHIVVVTDGDHMKEYNATNEDLLSYDWYIL